MNTVAKDIAKVGVGLAGSETLGHWWLGLWGTQLLPLDLGWFTFTREMNHALMLIWPLILLALASYAWADRRSVEISPPTQHPVPM